MKLIIVDDSNPFRETLRDFLENKLNHTVIGEAASGEEFLKMKNILYADIILMDIIMNEMNGLQVTKKIIWEYPFLKIIAVTMHIEEVFLLQLVEVGFMGCIFKTEIFENLQNALTEVRAGRRFYPKNIKIL